MNRLVVEHFKQWSEVLGKKSDSQEYQDLLNSLDVPIDPEQMQKYSDGTIYHCYYSLGLAVSFASDGLLDSVDFYQSSNQKKFSRYKSVSTKMLASSTISLSTTGKEFVELLGEPKEKGGGIKGSIDIWLRWMNLEVQISNRDWETAKDDTWSAITIFR